MAVPNIISGKLSTSISDHLSQILLAPNIPSSMSLNLNQTIMKPTGQDLIKKVLYLIISQLTGIIFCFHAIEKLKNPIKNFIERFGSLFDTHGSLTKTYKNKI